MYSNKLVTSNIFPKKRKQGREYNNNVSERDRAIGRYILSACTGFMCIFFHWPVHHFVLVEGKKTFPFQLFLERDVACLYQLFLINIISVTSQQETGSRIYIKQWPQ